MKYILPVLISCFFLFSCYENVDNSVQTTINEEDEHLIDTKITGALIGTDGNPISDYSVIINNQSHQVSNQYFLIELNDVKKYGQEFRAVKDNKEIAFSNVLLVEDNLNNLHLHLLPLITTSNASTNSQQSIQINTTDLLIIPTLAIKGFNNQTYNGDFTIEHREESNSDVLYKHGQRAIGEYAERLAIEMISFYDITVKDPNNNPLQIAEDGGTNLRIDRNAEGQPIALFKYHEDQQRWKWNSNHSNDITNHPIPSTGKYALASYQEGVYMEGKLTKDDIPIAYERMQWTSEDYIGTSTTTLEGKYNMILPKNQSFQINYKTPCNDITTGGSKSTTSEDKKDVIITTTNENYYNLGTQVFNCQKEIVDQANVILTQSDSKRVIVSDQASINGWVSICQGSFEVAAYDISNDTKGPGIEWTNGSGDQAAYLPLCDQYPDGYSFIKIKEDFKIFDPFEFSFDGQLTSLVATSGTVSFEFSGNSSGNYNEEEIHILVDDIDFGQDGYYISCQSSPVGCGINDCNVSHYEVAGGWLRVSFSGELWMRTIDPPKAGYFPVEGVIVCKTK